MFLKTYKQKSNEKKTQKEEMAQEETLVPVEHEQVEVLQPEESPESIVEEVSLITEAEQHEIDDTSNLDEGEYGEEEELASSEGHSWRLPTRGEVITALPFWGVILLGGLLRFWGLGDKPLHHDESLHAYYSLQLLHNLQNWSSCFNPGVTCYKYDPLLHGPFQFHAIALVYQISQWLGAPDHGVNTYTVRIAAATLGTVIVGLPYFLRDRLGTVGGMAGVFLAGGFS